MTTVDLILWSTGLFTWAFLGVVGSAFIFDKMADIIILHFWTKREFLVFVWDRMKKRQANDK